MAKIPAARQALRRVAASASVLALCALALSTPTSAAPSTAHRRAPSRSTVVQVQRLFRELGYPLGSERAGVFGIRTRGALSYFQHKYALPVTGYPNRRTIARMRAVVATLRGRPGARVGQPDTRASTAHDLVERVLGEHLPILAITVALAALICLLALSARGDSAQDSATAEETIAVASGER